MQPFGRPESVSVTSPGSKPVSTKSPDALVTAFWPVVAVTRTPLSEPAVGDVTVPLIRAGVSSVAASRSAATMMRTRNCATDASMSKPTVRVEETVCGAMERSNASQRKHSFDVSCVQPMSLKKPNGEPLPLAPVPFQSTDGTIVPATGTSTITSLPSPPVTSPGVVVTT